MTNEKKGKLILEVEPKTFVPTIDSKLLTSTELCKEACEIFRAIAGAEFTGVQFIPVPDPFRGMRFELIAFFTPTTGVREEQKVIMDAAEKAKTTNSKTLTTLGRLGSSQQGTRYELNERAKELFEDMMFVGPNGKVDWKTDAVEVKDDKIAYAPGSPRQSIPRVRVRFDMYRILGKLYGERSEENARYDYRIMLRNELGHPAMSMGMNSLVNQSMNTPRNWLLTVERLDTRELDNKAKELGFIYSSSSDQGSIPMITG